MNLERLLSSRRVVADDIETSILTTQKKTIRRYGIYKNAIGGKINEV